MGRFSHHVFKLADMHFKNHPGGHEGHEQHGAPEQHGQVAEHGGQGQHAEGGHEDHFEAPIKSLTYMLIMLILFTMLFESFTGWLERSLQKNKQFFVMLTKIYKELMILGFISFGLALIQYNITLDHEKLEVFEFVHLWLFFFAVFLVAFTIMFSFSLRSILKNLHQMEMDLLNNGADVAGGRCDCYMQCNCDQTLHVQNYAASKNLFLKEYQDAGIPSSFDFSAYLRFTVTDCVVEQMELTPQTWIIVILIMLMNLLRMEVFASEEEVAAGEVKATGIGAIQSAAILGWGLLISNVVLGLFLWRSRVKLFEQAKALSKTAVDEEAKEEEEDHADHHVSFAADSARVHIEGVVPCNSMLFYSIPKDIIMVCEAFYLAFVVVFVQADSGELSDKSTQIFVCVLPALIDLFFVCPQVISLFSFVKGMVQLNPHMVHEVKAEMTLNTHVKKQFTGMVLSFIKKARGAEKSPMTTEELGASLDLFWSAVTGLDELDAVTLSKQLRLQKRVSFSPEQITCIVGANQADKITKEVLFVPVFQEFQQLSGGNSKKCV